MQVLALVHERWRWWLLALIALLVLANIFVFRAVLAQPELTVSVLSVGKGEAVLVRSPSGVTMLVNGAADRSILRALGEALPFFDRSLDAVVAARPSTANIGGLSDVFARYQVSHYFSPGIPDTKVVSRALAEALAAETGLQQHAVSRGMRLELGGGAYADVLTKSGEPIVLYLVYGSTSFVLASDASDVEFDAAIQISSSTPPGVFHSDGLKISQESW